MISFCPITTITSSALCSGRRICCVASASAYLNTALVAPAPRRTVQAIAYKGRFKLHKEKIAYDCVSTALPARCPWRLAHRRHRRGR
jgi:hypothetical protein